MLFRPVYCGCFVLIVVVCGMYACRSVCVLQRVAMRCSVLHCAAVRCSAVRCGAVFAVCCSDCNVLQRVAVCCSALQCVAVRCSAWQCVAVCCCVLSIFLKSHEIFHGNGRG